MTELSVSTIFGYYTLSPYDWITRQVDGVMQWGQRYIKRKFTRDNVLESEEILDPVGWIYND